MPSDPDKSALRERSRAALASLTQDQAREASRQICTALLRHPECTPGRVVMAFLPVVGEPDLTEAIRAWMRAGVRICLPRVDWAACRMTPVEISSIDDGLAPGRHGLREPAAGSRVDQAKVDLVVVPGLAFDESGSRLGRGGGFYDRFLATTPAFRIGVCFEVQLAPLVPAGPLDVPMDAVVTERRVIRPRPPRR